MTKLHIGVVAVALAAGPLFAQRKTVVTATRLETAAIDVPRALEQFDSQDLRVGRQVRTLPEALHESPGIWVQKTGPAQGSPKFRGLTGFFTLLLVDGIRINNSIWRSGNVEYWNTVDSFSIDRLEVLRGPSSVLYGTDAVAGMAQVFSRGPGELEDGLHMQHHGVFRYSSAEQSFTERVETTGNADAFGWHAGVTYRDYSELVGGKTIGEQPQTGYRDLDADLKLVFDAGEGDRLTFGYQHANPMDGPRTHSTVFAKSWRGTTPGSDFQRDIDQQRDLAWLRFETERVGGLLFEGSNAALTLSYQRFREEENRVRKNSRRRIQGASVDQFGLQGRMELAVAEALRLVWGFDFYHEEVDSRFQEFNPNGTLRQTRLRGAVADNARYDQLGVYARGELPLDDEENLLAAVGLRFNYVAADADQVDPTGTSGFAPLHRSWNKFVASGSLIYNVAEAARVWTRVAQSFRAPNLSDLTRFDVALSGDLEIPSTGLDPERFTTVELGARFDDGLRAAEVTAFYTDARDLIQRTPTGRIIGGNTEVSKANVGQGFFAGVEAQASARLDFITIGGTSLDAWEVYGYGDLVQSVIDAADPADGARTHPKGLPPAKGQVGLRWRDLVDGRYGFEVFTRFAGGISASDYNAAERRNTQRIPPDGLPGWAIVGLRGSAQLSEELTLALAVENITNRDYRIFDSGLMEPGTNVILTVSASF